MTTIIPHDPETNFRDDLVTFIGEREGDVRRIYTDGKGIPTMGIGFALFHQTTGDQYTWRGGSAEALKTELRDEIGVVLTDENMAVLTETLTRLNDGDLPGVFELIPPSEPGERNGSYVNSEKNAFGFTLEDPDVTALLDLTLTEARTVLRTRLGTALYEKYDSSREMIALTSLAFNNPVLIGSGLTGALQGEDRAEAWFEIRYHSNADGENANRRYYESDLFGLYNESPGKDDYLAVYRMYTRH